MNLPKPTFSFLIGALPFIISLIPGWQLEIKEGRRDVTREHLLAPFMVKAPRKYRPP
jgi:hypothetical protein